MSYHIQFESNMSLTGANADKRIPCRQEVLKKIVVEIYSKILDKDINNSIGFDELDEKTSDNVLDVINRLKKSGKKSLVVSGIQNMKYKR